MTSVAPRPREAVPPHLGTALPLTAGSAPTRLCVDAPDPGAFAARAAPVAEVVDDPGQVRLAIRWASTALRAGDGSVDLRARFPFPMARRASRALTASSSQIIRSALAAGDPGSAPRGRGARAADGDLEGHPHCGGRRSSFFVSCARRRPALWGRVRAARPGVRGGIKTRPDALPGGADCHLALLASDGVDTTVDRERALSTPLKRLPGDSARARRRHPARRGEPARLRGQAAGWKEGHLEPRSASREHQSRDGDLQGAAWRLDVLLLARGARGPAGACRARGRDRHGAHRVRGSPWPRKPARAEAPGRSVRGHRRRRRLDGRADARGDGRAPPGRVSGHPPRRPTRACRRRGTQASHRPAAVHPAAGFRQPHPAGLPPLECRHLDHAPRVGVVYGDMELFGEVTGRHATPSLPYAPSGRQPRRRLLGCLRRTTWEECGGYDTEMPHPRGYEDWELWLQAAKRGWQIVRIARGDVRLPRPVGFLAPCMPVTREPPPPGALPRRQASGSLRCPSPRGPGRQGAGAGTGASRGRPHEGQCVSGRAGTRTRGSPPDPAELVLRFPCPAHSVPAPSCRRRTSPAEGHHVSEADEPSRGRRRPCTMVPPRSRAVPGRSDDEHPSRVRSLTVPA